MNYVKKFYFSYNWQTNKLSKLLILHIHIILTPTLLSKIKISMKVNIIFTLKPRVNLLLLLLNQIDIRAWNMSICEKIKSRNSQLNYHLFRNHYSEFSRIPSYRTVFRTIFLFGKYIKYHSVPSDDCKWGFATFENINTYVSYNPETLT